MADATGGAALASRPITHFIPRAGTTMPRLDGLTGLRWFAALAVFAHHMGNFAPVPIQPFLRFGSYGVTFFFVLSGFVLTWSARPGVSARTFWWRRVARIYPAHLVALALAIPVFYSLQPDPERWWVKPVSVGVLLLSAVILQGWSRDPSILFSGNPAAWTLTCEAFFYALYPALHRLIRPLSRRGALIVAWSVLALAFALRGIVALVPAAVAAGLPLPVSRLTEFVIGIAVARAMMLGWRPRVSPTVAIVALLLVVAWFTCSDSWFAGNAVNSVVLAWTNEWIIALCALVIVAVAAGELAGGCRWLRVRPVVLLGEWSYSFYLVHATVLYALLPVVGGKLATSWANLWWYLVVMLASLLVAGALHRLVEKPCERRLRAWSDERRARKGISGAVVS